MATHKRYQYAFSCLYYMDKFDNPEYAVARRFLDELGKRFDNRSGHRYQRVTDWRLMPGTNLENIVTETIPHSKFVLAFFTESFGECTLKNFLSQYSFKTKSGDAECIPIALRQKDIPPLYSFTMPVLFEPDWMRDERNWETLVNHLVNNLEEVFSKDEIPKQQPQSRPSPVPQHPAQAKSQYEEAVKAVYRDLPSDYLGLGMALDLPHAELTSIRENNLRNINAAVLEMLMLFKYRSELDDTSQVGKLADALMDLGRKDLASKVRQKLTADKDHQTIETEPITTMQPVEESQPSSPAEAPFSHPTSSPLLDPETPLSVENKSVDTMDSVEDSTDSVSMTRMSVDSGYQSTDLQRDQSEDTVSHDQKNLKKSDKDHQTIETEPKTTMQPVEESQPSAPAEAPFTQPTCSPLLDPQTALSSGNKSVDTMASVEGRTDSVSMTLMSVDSGYQSTDLQRDQSEDTVSNDQKNLKKYCNVAIVSPTPVTRDEPNGKAALPDIVPHCANLNCGKRTGGSEIGT